MSTTKQHLEEGKDLPTEGDSDSEELPASRLGTKEHWDSVYARELSNFSSMGDEGEVWFGEASLSRVIKWVKTCPSIGPSSSILDVGCGNGFTCVRLAEEGFSRITGIDYSEDAIHLARAVAKEHNVEDCKVEFLVADFLDSEAGLLTKNSDAGFFDMCLDKGTYDAISLNPADASSMRASYIRAVSKILRPESGRFIITSCNWTQQELQQHFQNGFSLEDVVPSPQFRFGGSIGKTVTSLVFKRV